MEVRGWKAHIGDVDGPFSNRYAAALPQFARAADFADNDNPRGVVFPLKIRHHAKIFAAQKMPIIIGFVLVRAG